VTWGCWAKFNFTWWLFNNFKPWLSRRCLYAFEKPSLFHRALDVTDCQLMVLLYLVRFVDKKIPLMNFLHRLWGSFSWLLTNVRKLSGKNIFQRFLLVVLRERLGDQFLGKDFSFWKVCAIIANALGDMLRYLGKEVLVFIHLLRSENLVRGLAIFNELLSDLLRHTLNNLSLFNGLGLFFRF
jgi:hypothetical protein